MHLLRNTTNGERCVWSFRKFPWLDLRPSICRGVCGSATTTFLKKLVGIGIVQSIAFVDFWGSTFLLYRFPPWPSITSIDVRHF